MESVCKVLVSFMQRALYIFTPPSHPYLFPPFHFLPFSVRECVTVAYLQELRCAQLETQIPSNPFTCKHKFFMKKHSNSLWMYLSKKICSWKVVGWGGARTEKAQWLKLSNQFKALSKIKRDEKFLCPLLSYKKN